MFLRILKRWKIDSVQGRNMGKDLPIGLYEQVINQKLKLDLQEIQDKCISTTQKIDAAEAPDILAKYAYNLFNYALKAKKDPDNQIDLCNKIVQLLRHELDDHYVDQFSLPDNPEQLLSIAEKAPIKQDIVRPETSLSESVLFTGAQADISLGHELEREIESSDKIYILMSFVKWSGLRLILDKLRRFTMKENCELKLITTSYMGATDYKAIEELASLPNTEIKVSYDTKRTRLHAKAYIFHRNTGFSTAYIGSSNISNAAMTSGLEWNTKVTKMDSPNVFDKCTATFETYWNNSDFVFYDKDKLEHKEKFRQALSEARNQKTKDDSILLIDIHPHIYQQEILDDLKIEREIYGKYRNLIVAATGTGKTFISAFDYKAFCQANPGQKNRLLFIAHRKEILEQSIKCFRHILKDQNFGDLHVGEHRADSIDHLFISIQSFNSIELHQQASDYYDYIIIDEFHHGSAASYQNLLNHFQPKILLGLTATPERMDRKDILAYFDGRIASEMRLPEAINRELLVPFHYFGITDTEDFRSIKWTQKGYDLVELSKRLTGNDIRADLTVQKISEYITDPNEMRGLCFCVSVEHADYMAEFFQKSGINAISLHSQKEFEIRKNVQDQLKSKEINLICVVDLYNEGVDIPYIDTVIFLRPTQSMTVFLQQLGRGLRLDDNKECLTVLDFVGNYNKDYNFEGKFRVLLGATKQPIKTEIEKGFPHSPTGCCIKLEEKAQRTILEHIQKYFSSSRSKMIEKIRSFEDETQKECTFLNFLSHYDLTPENFYKSDKWTWAQMCCDAGILNEFNDPDKEVLKKSIIRMKHLNTRKYLDFLLENWNSFAQINVKNLSDLQKRYLLMFYYQIWKKPLSEYGFKSGKDAFERMFSNTVYMQELKELLTYQKNHLHILPKEYELPYECGLELHGQYTRDEILAGLGIYSFEEKLSLREGVRYFKDLKTDIFLITLDKSEKDYSPSTMYLDYAINEELFHWQSQSTTSEESPTGKRYINHRSTGNTILLFVREKKKEKSLAVPFYFLGPATYVSHQGSRPMSITWKLKYKIPAHLLKISQRLAV